MKTVIFDIDGTLANVEHRIHYVRGKKKDWKAFSRNMHLDTPIEAMHELIRVLKAHYRIVLCTGRNEADRATTVAWLEKHGVPYDDLMMRADRDYRQDVVVKREMLDQIGRENVLFVVEDRSSVVAMWREEGLMCLQCAPGDF